MSDAWLEHRAISIAIAMAFGLAAAIFSLVFADQGRGRPGNRRVNARSDSGQQLQSIGSNYAGLASTSAVVWKETTRRRAKAKTADLRVVLFIDIETTGLNSLDRIVSFGGVKLNMLQPGEIRTVHLIFNPERRCSPAARFLHGWDNKTLTRQDPIWPYATALREWIRDADLIVAHNAAFVLRFLNNVFREYNLETLDIEKSECTMQQYRDRGAGSAALDEILARLGLPPQGGHGALEGAWRCMQVWLWLRALPWRLDFAWIGDSGPTNFRPAPPKRVRSKPRKASKPPKNAQDQHEIV